MLAVVVGAAYVTGHLWTGSSKMQQNTSGVLLCRQRWPGTAPLPIWGESCQNNLVLVCQSLPSCVAHSPCPGQRPCRKQLPSLPAQVSLTHLSLKSRGLCWDNGYFVCKQHARQSVLRQVPPASLAMTHRSVCKRLFRGPWRTQILAGPELKLAEFATVQPDQDGSRLLALSAI